MANTDYNNTPEYETAQSRISTLMNQIGEQIRAIINLKPAEDSSIIDEVIPEAGKNRFIIAQNKLIEAFSNREMLDERDAYIAKLEAELDKAKREAKTNHDFWYKEYQINKNLKSALQSLTSVVAES